MTTQTKKHWYQRWLFRIPLTFVLETFGFSSDIVNLIGVKVEQDDAKKGEIDK